MTSNGYSRYSAMTLRVDKRTSHHFELSAGYALSKLETTTADGLGLGGGTLVNRNVAANFGTAPLDRRHRLTFNGILELPKGFRLSAISTRAGVQHLQRLESRRSGGIAVVSL